MYFDRVIQETEADNNVANVINSNQEFDFYDAALRWLYQPTDKDNLRVNFILINNNLGFNETATVNGSPQTRRSNISQNTLAIGLHYKRQWNERLTSIINIYDNEYKLNALNADVLNNQLQLQENIVSETSVQLNNQYGLLLKCKNVTLITPYTDLLATSQGQFDWMKYLFKIKS